MQFMPFALNAQFKARVVRATGIVAATLLAMSVLPLEVHATKQDSLKKPLAKQKSSGKTTYRASPSEESRAERDRRLFRECRGMHDAGACKGYTRR